MNQEVKQQWVTALRSGEYQQGVGRLHGKDSNSHEFCCLGVLCDLYAKAYPNHEYNGWKPQPKSSTIDFVYFDKASNQVLTENEYLPTPVMEWAELANNVPDVEYIDRLTDVTDLNDEEKLSFTELADLIEDQL